MIRELLLAYSSPAAFVVVVAFISRWYYKTNRDVAENKQAIRGVAKASKAGDDRLEEIEKDWKRMTGRWKTETNNKIQSVAEGMAEIRGQLTEMSKSLDRWMVKNGKH